MSWADIAGQSSAVRFLRRAAASGKLAHAYLFAGPEGVGKRTTALELAKVILCRAPGAENGACDTCPSCVKIASVPPTHPDLLVVAPEGRLVKKDQMRELQKEMYARPSEGKARLAIIDGADRMNAEAGNRVLKLLEEPPSYALFILITNNLSGVLPTLTSRCQVVNFTPLTLEDIEGLLQKRWGLQPEQAQLFAALSGGSLGRAASMVQDSEVLLQRDETYELLARMNDMDDFSLLEYAGGWDKQKEQIDARLEMLLMWLRDALLVVEGGSEKLLINVDRVRPVRELAERYGSKRLIRMLEIVMQTRGVLQRNANSRLALDVLLLRLSDLAHASLPS